MYTFCVPKSHFNLLILHYQNQTNSNLTSLLGSVKWLTTTKVTRYKRCFSSFLLVLSLVRCSRYIRRGGNSN